MQRVFLFLIVKPLYMSNIYRHFRKKRPQDKFALDATKKKRNIAKKLSKDSKKLFRVKGMEYCLRIFVRLSFGDFGFADMIRLSHCILEKLMQICFPLKTSSYPFSLTPTQWGACQNTRYRVTLLFSVPCLTLTFLSPSYQPLPPSLHIPFVFSVSLEIPIFGLFHEQTSQERDLVRNVFCFSDGINAQFLTFFVCVSTFLPQKWLTIFFFYKIPSHKVMFVQNASLFCSHRKSDHLCLQQRCPFLKMLPAFLCRRNIIWLNKPLS